MLGARARPLREGMQYAPAKTTLAVTPRQSRERRPTLPPNTTMSLRPQMSGLASGGQAARRIARAVVGLG